MARYQGGMIGSVANTPSGTAYIGRANGVFPLPQQIVYKRSSIWAIGQTIPNPPSIGTATSMGSGSISVAFIAPVQNGGSNITSYTVTSSGGQTGTGTSSPIVVGGLTASTSYTFTVTATNAVGTSTSSEISNSLTPAITDPYWSNVTILLNGDDLLDHSSSIKTITNNNGVTVNTSTKKFGTGSLTTGTGYLTSSLTSTNTIGLSNDFTIEFWFYPNGAQSSWVGFCGNYMDAGYGARSSWAIGYDGGGTGISCSWAFSSGSYIGTATTTVTNDTWHHLAFVRSGSVFTMYIDGVAKSSVTDARAIYDGGSNLEIGSYITGAYRFNGYMDDFRITKGVARYTANFTAPTAAFPTI